MKRLVTFLLLSCLGLVQAQLSGRAQLLPSTSIDYSTTFPLTESPISEGGYWINGSVAGGNSWGNVQTAGGQAYGVSEPTQYGDPTAVLTGTWSTTQSAQATVKVNTTPRSCCHEVELRLRSTISANSITGYEVNCSVTSRNPYMQVVRWNGANGSFTYLGGNSSIQCVDGDVIKASITGESNSTVINVWYNGNPVTFDVGTDVLDNTGGGDQGFTGGSPGIGFYDNQDEDWNDFGFFSFTAMGGYPRGQVADPTLSPAPGTYNTEVLVAISDTTSGATICYTTDGTTPAATSGTCTAGTTYSAPIPISTPGMLINAIASTSGLTNSNVVSGTYTYTLGATTGGISAVTGQNTGGQSVHGVPGMLAFPASLTSGNQIIVAMHCYSASTTPTINPPVKASGTAILGSFTQDGVVNFTGPHFFSAKIYRALVNSGGSLALSFSGTNCSGGIVMMDEFQGIMGVDGSAVINAGTGSIENGGSVNTSASGMVLMTSGEDSTANFTYSQSDTNIFRDSVGGTDFTGQTEYRITTSAGTYALTATTGGDWAWWALLVAYR